MLVIIGANDDGEFITANPEHLGVGKYLANQPRKAE